MNLLLFIFQVAAIGFSFGLLGWVVGSGRGYEEGYQVGRKVGYHDRYDDNEVTAPARDELAIALLKADPEAYFRVTRQRADDV